MADTVKSTLKIRQLSEHDVTVKFQQFGMDVYFTNVGAVDCPECGTVHVDGHIMQMALDDVAVNWCPCGFIWLQHVDGQIIPLSNWLALNALTDSSLLHRDRPLSREVVPHIQTLLRTNHDHSLSFDGGLSHLYYMHEDGKWVIDIAHTPPEFYDNFAEAWIRYAELQGAFDNRLDQILVDDLPEPDKIVKFTENGPVQ